MTPAILTRGTKYDALLLFPILPLLLEYGFRHILVALQRQTDTVRTFLRGSINTTDPK